jgi:hypothetical protein
MASRREQKEQRRQERLAREAAAQSSQNQRKLIGYVAAGGVVLVALVIGVVVLAGGGGGGDASADVLPDGGSYPEPREMDSVAAAAKVGGCELRSYKSTGRNHLSDITQTVKYSSKPPTSGDHFQEWAEDGAYEDPPDVKKVVHALEHGRVIIWFKRDLPSEQRAALNAYFEDDTYQMLILPDETGMKYDVAVTAWNRDPRPDGTGRLLGCQSFGDDIFTAIDTFKNENRGQGPEPVP